MSADRETRTFKQEQRSCFYHEAGDQPSAATFSAAAGGFSTAGMATTAAGGVAFLGSTAGGAVTSGQGGEGMGTS